jgi:hypothetical protein
VALDQLLDDRLIFTFGSDGKCYTKQDDLQLHRSRQQVLTKVGLRLCARPGIVLRRLTATLDDAAALDDIVNVTQKVGRL